MSSEDGEYEYKKERELAGARVAFAESIVSADNSAEILMALNNLFRLEVEKTMHVHESGKKSQARRLKHTTDEIFTIMMCAMYLAQEKFDR